MAEELVEEFEPVTLEELDERAALLKRVDNKYAVEHDRVAQLLERLRPDHQVLEIDGRRMFGYRSTYFDTPELRCFTDHVEDRRPRFKARTRLYVDADSCVFEVKLKREDDETDKRQTEHAARDGLILVETKSENGESPADRALAELGLEPISLSKYRVGMSLVGGAEAGDQPGSDLFERG